MSVTRVPVSSQLLLRLKTYMILDTGQEINDILSIATKKINNVNFQIKYNIFKDIHMEYINTNNLIDKYPNK